MELDNQENLNSEMEGQENTDSENGEEESTEESTDESGEESNEEEYTEHEKQLYARLKKAEKELKELKEVKKDPKPAKKEQASDEVTISRLEVRGVMEPDDQTYVLRFAKAEGISPIEALSDPIVTDRLAANKRERESANATPRSNNRANNQVDEVDVIVRKYKRLESEGKDPATALPDNNPALTSKVLKKLKNGA